MRVPRVLVSATRQKDQAAIPSPMWFTVLGLDIWGSEQRRERESEASEIHRTRKWPASHGWESGVMVRRFVAGRMVLVFMGQTEKKDGWAPDRL